jgi:hypothetical protein
MLGDKVIYKFSKNVLRECKFLPMLVVYKYPEDYPKDFVIRLFDADSPTPYVMLLDSYAEVEGAIPHEMFLFPRHGDDDKCIVETYL